MVLSLVCQRQSWGHSIIAPPTVWIPYDSIVFHPSSLSPHALTRLHVRLYCNFVVMAMELQHICSLHWIPVQDWHLDTGTSQGHPAHQILALILTSSDGQTTEGHPKHPIYWSSYSSRLLYDGSFGAGVKEWELKSKRKGKLFVFFGVVAPKPRKSWQSWLRGQRWSGLWQTDQQCFRDRCWWTEEHQVNKLYVSFRYSNLALL